MLLYIPAALPPMPKINTEMLSNKEWGPPTADGEYCWEMIKLVGDNKDIYSHKDLLEDFKKENYDFMQWISCLPYKELINAKIHYQHRLLGVPVHIDLTQPNKDINHYHHLYYNEPAGYRVILSGKLKNTLYLWNENKEKIYCNMPCDKSTNTYLMNCTTGIHGVESDLGRAVLFLQFTLDLNRHHKIVKNSIKKYNDYAVRIRNNIIHK